jgi:hypothetical protein
MTNLYATHSKIDVVSQKLIGVKESKQAEQKHQEVSELVFSMMLKEAMPKDEGLMGSGQMGAMFNSEMAHYLAHNSNFKLSDDIQKHLIKIQEV